MNHDVQWSFLQLHLDICTQPSLSTLEPWWMEKRPFATSDKDNNLLSEGHKCRRPCCFYDYFSCKKFIQFSAFCQTFPLISSLKQFLNVSLQKGVCCINWPKIRVSQNCSIPQTVNYQCKCSKKGFHKGEKNKCR